MHLLLVTVLSKLNLVKQAQYSNLFVRKTTAIRKVFMGSINCSSEKILSLEDSKTLVWNSNCFRLKHGYKA